MDLPPVIEGPLPWQWAGFSSLEYLWVDMLWVEDGICVDLDVDVNVSPCCLAGTYLMQRVRASSREASLYRCGNTWHERRLTVGMYGQ